MLLLHIGCANKIYRGFVNSDMKDWGVPGSEIMNISEPWPYEDETVDGIVSMHVLQQLTWRELIVTFREMHRVLKKGGVMRMGCPMIETTEKSLDHLLGWKDINLFSFDLLKKVLVDRIGFTKFRERGYKRSYLPKLAKVDCRRGRGTKYMDVIK